MRVNAKSVVERPLLYDYKTKKEKKENRKETKEYVRLIAVGLQPVR